MSSSNPTSNCFSAKHPLSPEALPKISTPSKTKEPVNEKHPSSTEAISKIFTSSKVEEPADHDKTYQVFRNNSTAIEITVKSVPKSSKRKFTVRPSSSNDITKLANDNQLLNNSIIKSEARIELLRRGFKNIVLELNRQLKTSTKREIDCEAENIALRLENEKLKALLEIKQNNIGKLRKEMNHVRRALKFVIKGLCSTTRVLNVSKHSDLESSDLDKEFGKEFHENILAKADSYNADSFTYGNEKSQDSTSPRD